MWLVEAQFDNGAHRRKLLKPGRSYTVGRKDPADLVLSSKTVSQLTTIFDVGAFSNDDASDFDSRPSVTLRNVHEKKPVHVVRGGGERERDEGVRGGQGDDDDDYDDDDGAQREGEETVEEVMPGTSTPLKHGDQVKITREIRISLRWWPSQFVAGAKTDRHAVEKRLESCASLGIHLVRNAKSWLPGGSHLCVAQVRLTATILSATAAAAHIVTLAYLDDLLQHGALPPSDPASLEVSADNLPDPAHHFPEVATTEMSADEVKAKLQRNTRRINLFNGATALCLHPGTEPDPRIQSALDLFRACAGRVETLSLDDANLSTEGEAQRTLRPYKTAALSWYASRGEAAKDAPDGGLVVVHDAQDHQGEGWYRNLTQATRSMDVRMTDDGVAAITLAVIHCEPRERLNTTASLLSLSQLVSQSLAASQGNQDVSVSRTVDDIDVNAAPAAPPIAADLEEASMPLPTAATAGSIEPPAPESSSPPRPMPAPAPAEAALPPSQAPAASQAPERRSRRRAIPARTNAFDELFGATSDADHTPSPSASQQAAAPQAPPTDSMAVDPPPPSSSYARSGAQIKRRAAATKLSRISDIFGSALDPVAEGREAADSAATEESYRKTKRYRAMLEQEDAGAVPDSQMPDAEAKHSVGSGSRKRGAEDSADGEAEGRTSTRPSKRQATLEPEERAASAETRRRQVSGGATQQQEEAPAEEEESQSAAALNRQKKRSTTQAQAQAQTQEQGVIRAEKGPRGNVPGQAPDCEPEFLQALATSRKGKKNAMDDFDKEFNNLKLAKLPAGGSGSRSGTRGGGSRAGKGSAAEQPISIEDDEDYNAWKETALDDFDVPVGNFVQVDFVPLVVRTRGADVKAAAAAGQHSDSQWAGRPNFKKFRAKGRAERKPLALGLAEHQDYGVGGDYLGKPKLDLLMDAHPDSDGAADDPNDDMPTVRAPGPSLASTGRVARKGSNILQALRDSDDDDEGAASDVDLTLRGNANTKGKGKARTAAAAAAAAAGKKAPTAAKGKTAAAARSRARRAALASSDEDDGDLTPASDDDADETAQPDLRLARRVEDADFSMSTSGAAGGGGGSRARQPAAARMRTSRSTSVATAGGADGDGTTPTTVSASSTGTGTARGRKRPAPASASRRGGGGGAGASDDSAAGESDSDGGFKGFRGAGGRGGGTARTRAKRARV